MLNIKLIGIETRHMAKRVTIMLDDDLVKKLYELQAKLIKGTAKSVSFSSIVNQTLRKDVK